MEFKVELSRPQGCTLSATLSRCRVKVMDTDYFPSSDFGPAVEQGKVGQLLGFPLFAAYFAWNYRRMKLKWKVLISVTIVLNQVSNVYNLVMIITNIYMVNVVLHVDADVEDEVLLASRLHVAYVIAAIHIFPWLVIHFWDICSIRIDVDGRSELLLQQSIFRRYLNLSEESQELVPFEVLNFALTTEAPAVAGGFNGSLSIVEVFLGVAMNLAFVIHQNPASVPFVVIIPLVVTLWSVFRHWCFPPLTPKKEVTGLDSVSNEVHDNIGLVRAFSLRADMRDDFSEKALLLRTKLRQMAQNSGITQFGLAWIPSIVTGMYILFGVPRVVRGDVTLGTFLAIIAIIAKVGAATLKAHGAVMKIVATFVPLRNVTILLNRRTDLVESKALVEGQLSVARNAKGPLRDVPIRCEGLGLGAESGPHVFWNVHLEAKQGEIVALFGPKKCGKHRFLHMIAHQSFPSSGHVSMPAQFRPLLLPREPVFLKNSLLTNLTVGATQDQKNDYDRVKGILEDCTLDHFIPTINRDIEALRKPGPDQPQADEDVTWVDYTTFTDRRLMSFARAFIMAPEVMVLINPFIFYDVGQSKNIKALLMEHVRSRGLRRGPVNPTWFLKTVFFSTEDQEECLFADRIWTFEANAADANASWRIDARQNVAERQISGKSH